MGILYGNQNVDERYSAIVEPNLYTDDILIPNVTFTAKYSIGPAGQIFVHQIDKKTVSVGTPGRDFTDVGADDTLIPIALNNNYQQSRKLYGVQSHLSEKQDVTPHWHVWQLRVLLTAQPLLSQPLTVLSRCYWA